MTIETEELVKLLLNQVKTISIENGYLLFMNKLKIHNREGTISYYKAILKYILKYIQSKINNIDEINNELINSYINFRCKTVKNITINKEIKALHTMCKFLLDNMYINQINFKYQKLEEEKTLVPSIKKEDMIKIIKYLDNPKINKEYKLAFLLILTTGIRTSELLHIKVQNIDFKLNKILLDFTKSKRSRYIYLLDPIKMELKDIVSSNDYLFKITSNGLRLFFKKLKKRLNVEILSPHKLRHYYATQLYNKSKDIQLVSELLGHQEIKTTQIYLDINNKVIQKKNTLYNPINDLLTNTCL